jgi:4-amino-4-deoxy-L-arabinose transferase-like glycosyltransferase
MFAADLESTAGRSLSGCKSGGSDGRISSFWQRALMAERSRWVLLVLALLVVVGLLAWHGNNLDAFSLSNDEGTHLMWAWLVHSGHPLYSETTSVQPPLLIVLLDWAFDVGGVNLVTGRLLVLGFLALTVTTLIWLAWLVRGGTDNLTGWVAAFVAALAFSISPLAFALSRVAMGEVPAVALSVLAVALALMYARRGGWGWLVLSGVAYGLGLLVKAINPLVLLPIGWFILTRRKPSDWRHTSARLCPCGMSLRETLPGAIGWAVAALAPVALCFLIYDPAAFYDQVIAFRFDLRVAYPLQLSRNLTWLEYFARQQWGIVSLALVGLVMLIYRARWDVLIPLGLWLLGAVITVLTHSPLFPHHTIIMLPPLALLAGMATAETWEMTREKRWGWSSLGLAGGAAFLLAMPGAVQADQEVLGARFGREADAISVLERVTRPTDNVISDNLLLAFMAERQSPPPFGDLAQVAIDSGHQTSQRLIALSEAYPVEAVANWAQRLPYMTEYMQWVEDHYLVRRVWDNHHVLYFGRKTAADQVPHPRQVRFGGGVELVGFDAQMAEASPDIGSRLFLPVPPDESAALQPKGRAALQVTLFWTASQTPDQDYTVFVHLYDVAGELRASHDGPPLYGYLPTREWKIHEIIPDRHDIPLPGDLPPGQYRLVAGMYDPATGVRLTVTDAQGAKIGDHTLLETIAIK